MTNHNGRPFQTSTMKPADNPCSHCKKTHLHPCGYLSGEQAVIHFMPLDQVTDRKHFTRLNEMGYRRSGAYIYHPACPECNACIPLRIPCKTFTPSRSQRKLWKMNTDITVMEAEPGFSEERYSLYATYINARHHDGEMYPPSKEQFMDFLHDGSIWSRFFELRSSSGELVAVTVADLMDNSMALLYTFFHPESMCRSLGTYSILCMIEYAKQQGFAWVYLGYWIEQCEKMVYKNRFRPCEILTDGQWKVPD